jgi:hypothetical protein
MPVPDFSPGEVLTAAAMDSIGLWKVASGTLSGTTTNFQGCFTTNYDNYLIEMEGLQLNTTGDIFCRFLNGSTPDAGNYRYAYVGLKSTNTAFNDANNSATAGYIGYASGISEPNGGVTMTVYNPKRVSRSMLTSQVYGYSGEWYSRFGGTQRNDATSHDGIQFTTLGAQTMTGNVTIYGLRK